MSELIKVEGKSEKNIPYEIVVEYQIETPFLALFRVTLLNVDSGANEGERFITFDLSNSTSDLPLKFEPGTYAASVLYCAGKKVVVEAAKCMDEGSQTTSELIDCMKTKGKKLSVALALCLIKGFWAD
jgi:hypothetical protein